MNPCQIQLCSFHLKEHPNIEIPSNDKIIVTMEHDSKLLFELESDR